MNIIKKAFGQTYEKLLGNIGMNIWFPQTGLIKTASGMKYD